MADGWTCPICGWATRQGGNENWYNWSDDCEAHLARCKQKQEVDSHE